MPELVAQPIQPGPHNEATLAQVEHLLEKAEPGEAALVGPNDERTTLPAVLEEVLRQAVAALKLGHAVTVVATSRELTTQEAADLLNISRPYLVKLLERGELPFRRSGTHRRLDLGEVMRYRATRTAGRLAALAEMAAEAESRGTVKR